jgi:RNA polymerase sigma factor (sigma-70 family)
MAARIPLASDPAPAPAAFLEWVGGLAAQHRSLLTGVARREQLGAEDAIDAVQEAFLTYFTMAEARALVGDAEGSRRLLVGVTRNVARNRRRLHAVARPHDAEEALGGLADDGPRADELIASAEEQAQLEGCVRRLADLQRAVLLLRLFDGSAGDDVARSLGIQPGHVAVLLHRAKANLARCMTEPCPSGTPDGDCPSGCPECRSLR